MIVKMKWLYLPHWQFVWRIITAAATFIVQTQSHIDFDRRSVQSILCLFVAYIYDTQQTSATIVATFIWPTLKTELPWTSEQPKVVACIYLFIAGYDKSHGIQFSAVTNTRTFIQLIQVRGFFVWRHHEWLECSTQRTLIRRLSFRIPNNAATQLSAGNLLFALITRTNKKKSKNLLHVVNHKNRHEQRQQKTKQQSIAWLDYHVTNLVYFGRLAGRIVRFGKFIKCCCCSGDDWCWERN